jgi:DNA repair protein RecN (Recombination protein N)
VARRLKLAPQQLPSELENLRVKLHALEHAQDVAALTHRLEAARQEYDEQARGVTVGRERAAAELSAGVTQRIERLGMQGGRLSITVEPGEPTVHGVDRIDFRVAGHSGASPRSLAKVASGGELSRISLAISELAAQANPVPTLIFDEADAGVGGAVAEVIGELMRKLGESRQVLCVTHLPQVAAKGNQHLCVSKDRSDTGTVSRIEVLERARRIDEIARMLGGVEITATTRKHARELLG